MVNKVQSSLAENEWVEDCQHRKQAKKSRLKSIKDAVPLQSTVDWSFIGQSLIVHKNSIKSIHQKNFVISKAARHGKTIQIQTNATTSV